VRFSTENGYISETVRDTAKVTINHQEEIKLKTSTLDDLEGH